MTEVGGGWRPSGGRTNGLGYGSDDDDDDPFEEGWWYDVIRSALEIVPLFTILISFNMFLFYGIRFLIQYIEFHVFN